MQTLQWDSPQPDSVVSGVTTMKVKASGISRISWYVDGVLKGKDIEAPFTFDWYTYRYPDGKHSIKAVSGNGKLMIAESFLVANGVPSVISNSLENGMTVSDIYDWAIIAKGNCVEIEYWLTLPNQPPKLLGYVHGDITKPFVFRWDTTFSPNTTQALMGVVCVDSMGNRFKDENRKTITIHNPIVSVTLSGEAQVDKTMRATISCQ